MGEGKKPLFEPSFNRAAKVRGGQDRLTSDAGTLLLREADHRLDLTKSLAAKEKWAEVGQTGDAVRKHAARLVLRLEAMLERD